MNDKKEYEKIRVEIVNIDSNDVIATSTTNVDKDGWTIITQDKNGTW